jgi:hypothetical protein
MVMMAVLDFLDYPIQFFNQTLARFSGYSWVLYIFVGLAVIIAITVIVMLFIRKKNQWTHTLKVRRVLQNGLLSEPVIHKMRRFPLIKHAEVFELEKPVLGGYLMPELDSYSGVNEYSIILDNNNRIYTNKGEYFNPSESSVNVSAKHSEIDIARSNLRADFQNINKTSKRIEWATIAKYAMLSVLIIAVMIVSIVGIGEWGDAQKEKAEMERATAEAMRNLATALETSEATVNTQSLIIDKLNELYRGENIQQIVRRSTNATQT